ncbi:MAG TPA: hypothetical protein VJS65_14365, partial [Verrucomicrobiae bacterium]|nr:hypothetical protein [Verrucomicrobiae bacterium]
SPINAAAACLIVMAITAFSLEPARADETNEVRKEENGKKRVFNFDGGSPVDFVVALDRHFRTRLVQVLTLPETLSRTRVPKLRVAAEDPREVLTLYNRLDNPALGQWRFEPAQKSADTNLNVLMLVPDKATSSASTGRSPTRVKGVALAGVPEAQWETLMRDIDQAKVYGEEIAAKGGGDLFVGTLRVQRDSKILIAAGSEAYMDMVESLVQAHRLNASIETTNASRQVKGSDGAPK